MKKIEEITTFHDVGSLLQPVVAYEVSAVDLVRDRRAVDLKTAVEDAVEAMDHNDTSYLVIRLVK